MPRYKVATRFKGTRGLWIGKSGEDGHFVRIAADAIVDLPEDHAHDFSRRHPGILVPFDENAQETPPPADAAVVTPPETKQFRKVTKRGSGG